MTSSFLRMAGPVLPRTQLKNIQTYRILNSAHRRIVANVHTGRRLSRWLTLAAGPPTWPGCCWLCRPGSFWVAMLGEIALMAVTGAWIVSIFGSSANLASSST